ncbi:MAG TPA: PIG-L family deacetylase [Thermoanaerobaculia bacterium]|nr:PIG-L family deacetylase [Thermoanaerobaculia bacterium]
MSRLTSPALAARILACALMVEVTASSHLQASGERRPAGPSAAVIGPRTSGVPPAPPSSEEGLGPGEEKAAAAQGGPALAAFPPGTLLWIGAHPDDEVLAAPLLGFLCSDGRHSCAFLVATRGENGICRLAGGCLPDLATVRSAEMQDAAALYGAALIQDSLPDLFGPTPLAVRQGWAAFQGSDEQLRAALAAVIRQIAPAAILTFDPRHGTTCHDAHRAVGRLAVQVVRELGAAAPLLFLLESRVVIAPAGAAIDWSKAVADDPAVLRFSAERPLPGGPGTGWDFLLANARRHPSQLDATFLASLARVPAAARQTHVLRSTDFRFDPRYLTLCP